MSQTAVRFYLNAEGLVCGGLCDDPSFAGKFDLAHIPIRTLEEGGVAIAWHGEPFKHSMDYVGSVDAPATEQERAA